MKGLNKRDLLALKQEINANLSIKKRIRRNKSVHTDKEYHNLYVFYRNNIMHNNNKYQGIYKTRMLRSREMMRSFSSYVNNVVKAMKEFATEKEKADFDAFLNELNKL